MTPTTFSMQPATFTIDAANDEAPIIARGFYDFRYNWNGFPQPYFDKQTAQRLCEILKPQPFGVVFSEARDVVLQVEEDGTAEICGRLEINGATYYAVGNCWTWLIADDDQTEALNAV